MSKKIIAGIVPCGILMMVLSSYAQEGRGGRGGASNLADFPDNSQSLAHKDAAKKMAGDDPVLNRVWTFFLHGERYQQAWPGSRRHESIRQLVRSYK